MPLVVGVSFKKAGKVYYFDPVGLELHEGDFVITETARGIEFGEVLIEPRDVPDEEIVPPLKKIVRKATPADVDRDAQNRQREKQAFATCQQRIHAHNLPMKLIEAECCFDSSQITFYFSAESRIDFRELVKDLAGTLRTKIQLHQVGVRDEAKLFGGLGPCGRPLCCSSFLNGFEPVSMKMAKEQSLFLNPLKFSGICGKLMCCLKYEYPTYKEAKSRLPSVGSVVTTHKGAGRVVEINVIRETFGIELENGAVLHCTSADLAGSPCAAHAGCGGCGMTQTVEQPDDPAEEPVAEAGGRGISGEGTPDSTVPKNGERRRSSRRGRRRRSGGEKEQGAESSGQGTGSD